MRFIVEDKPGVIADISTILRDNDVSIESLVQHGRDYDGGAVAVVIMTHKASYGALNLCTDLILNLPFAVGGACVLRIEDI